MPDISMQERLLPCLLERLSDSEPSSQKEGRDQRVVSLKRYRESVLGDIRALLNATRSLPREEAEEFSEVARSVLNYGIPNLCGVTVSGVSIEQLEREIAEAIRFFEPRIDRDSFSVRASTSAEHTTGNAVSLVIEGELWAQPMPEQLYLSTELDLETGRWLIRGLSDG